MRINKELATYYGLTPRHRPKFRIVTASEQTEKRFGKFREFYGKLFVREINGLQETLKYPYIPKGAKVLEMWLSPEVCYTREIPETIEGSYEPLFVFWNFEMNEPLPIIDEQVHRIIWTLYHPELPGHKKSLMETEEEVTKAKEIQRTVDELENESPYLAGKIHVGEAIVRP